jgi:hypothetical protein
MEPNYSLTNILILLPYGAYYLGVLIRRYALPGDSKASLGCQLLLGIPVSLVVVSPLLMTVMPNISNVPGYLLAMGLIMEQGMVLNETVVSHLKDLVKGQVPVPVTQ